MSSVDLYKKMRGGKDSDFLDFFFLFGQAKRKENFKNQFQNQPADASFLSMTCQAHNSTTTNHPSTFLTKSRVSPKICDAVSR
jgi:hypothetical protein